MSTPRRLVKFGELPIGSLFSFGLYIGNSVFRKNAEPRPGQPDSEWRENDQDVGIGLSCYCAPSEGRENEAQYVELADSMPTEPTVYS